MNHHAQHAPTRVIASMPETLNPTTLPRSASTPKRFRSPTLLPRILDQPGRAVFLQWLGIHTRLQELDLPSFFLEQTPRQLAVSRRL